ncbi:(2Fe-2S)-binding protein [Crassaminicella thermophila]|uniref:(2Fe-2S)-binding protein n=1 Tax=Crassaminicella thermophila TaxID=2599308 RepID=A0A5C0SD47_CRATE|nr:(2Fe-2S)-binding protein [Crassaminicella thermophila]QEK12443.1 (2Fe-2S)-binding protein [Crassaminicella thermophila]
MEKEIICRCEEVTRDEIEETIKNGATTMNEIKKWTRAGMGLCQGRICRKLVEKILAEKTGKKPENIEPSTYRQPVRPFKMGILRNDEND